MSDARQRVIDGALDLFARQGYAGTSVAQIEKAAGLTPGAGGLYAHFDSKAEVLAAAIERSETLADMGYAMLDALPLGDLRAELTLIARGSFVLFDAAQSWIRLALREGDQFAELFADAHERVASRPYRYLADLLASKVNASELDEHDPQAIADILLGAISTYWMQSRIFNWHPNDVGQERFITAWVDLALRLAPQPPPDTPAKRRSRMKRSS
ncbi:MAG TPA: TetR/AcrR family transcriptional regulator [Jiangellaceae bacterium]|nr:TetR/AcrR family transcriptional regulator [Jiangellaceae bacterium]